MSHRQDRLIHQLLGSLDIDTTVFHLGQYCGAWKASTSGLARAGFHLVLHGECWLHLAGHEEPHRLRGGDGVFFLRDVEHFLSQERDVVRAGLSPRQAMQAVDFKVPDSTALACGFFDYRAPLTQLLLASLPPYVVLGAEDPELAEARGLFGLILREAEVAGEEASPLIARLVDVLFFYVLRHLVQRQEISPCFWAVLAQPEFAPLVAALVEAPGEEWGLERMAALCHMSRATFCKRFSLVAGTSPSLFLAQIRMKLAVQLIRKGALLVPHGGAGGLPVRCGFFPGFQKSDRHLAGGLAAGWGAAPRLAA